MKSSIAAIALAAGLGSRMRSARAKVLHELGGEPIISRALRALAALKPDPLVLVLGHQAPEVEAVVRGDRNGADRDDSFANRLRCVLQPEQRGTGDAVRCALAVIPPNFDGDILIGYGDMPMLNAATLDQFVNDHRESGLQLSFISLIVDDPAAYGRVVRDTDGLVRAIVEARDASPDEMAVREINTGIYIADAGLLREIVDEIRPNNMQHEYYLTDIVKIARQRGYQVGTWRATVAEEFAGINSREEMARMERHLREETNRRLMAAGVTFIDPATAYIGPEVEIGRDTTIGPNVQIIGRCRIGSEVLIEGTAWLRDVEIGDRSHLKMGVRAENCMIGAECEVGPFANLREGTRLEGHNRIGNFVETKKAHIGRGSKASHLSYLGDAVIGEDTNVGCGVITVNYDGYDKHETRIGDRCMVGCDTQLVAPVKIGDDVYVASGTTILRDVEDGALVMSQHPQREKSGWSAQWHRRHAGHPKARDTTSVRK